MNRSTLQAIVCAASLTLIGMPAMAGFTYKVVNVIPNNQSTEAAQNDEPSIAVNPADTKSVMVSSFRSGAAQQPYFFTNAANQQTWSEPSSQIHGDTTIDWSTNGSIFMARAFQSGAVIDSQVHRSSAPNPPVALFGLPNSVMTTVRAAANIDQPWINTKGNAVYVAHTDNGRAANKTASVEFTLDAQTNFNGGVWKAVPIEKGAPTPPAGVPGNAAAVRVVADPFSDKVYALFMRPTGAPVAAPAGDFNGQIICVRDDNKGNGPAAGQEFEALGATGSNILGFNVNRDIPYNATLLGANERLGSDISLAVDHNTPDRIYAAYVEAAKDPADNVIKPRVRVLVSNNGGGLWSLERDCEYNTALPALAVADGGTLGLMYTEFKGNQLKTHMSTVSYDDFVNDFSGKRTNDILAQFTDGTPAIVGASATNPYIGDYQDLQAIGKDFFGTFSASNDPKGANFPQGVFFQRNFNDGTNNFNMAQIAPGDTYSLGTLAAADAVSIDPYFFTVTVPEPVAAMPILLLALTSRRRRIS